MPKATPESLQPTSVSPLLAVRSSAVTVRPPLGKVNDVGIPRRNGGRTNSHAKSNDKEINAKEKGAFVQQQKLLVTAEPLGLLKRWSMF
ncbi:hypothetical protein HPP92_018537 [Vanilla planifolia]|uniref:Uncharacterized protein n=1 Tax=Vanilla planifolia TaxID=51239 RepID=A0A835UMC4_VANPL|nr:hypothetical protein HPP92_018537 [Vanilla planifolia]